jgi:hypothetical protein
MLNSIVTVLAVLLANPPGLVSLSFSREKESIVPMLRDSTYGTIPSESHDPRKSALTIA